MSDSDGDVPAPPPKPQTTESVPALKSRISELETQVADLKTKLHTYQQENGAYAAEIEKLKAQIAELTNEQKTLKETLQNDQQQITTLQEQLVAEKKAQQANPEQTKTTTTNTNNTNNNNANNTSTGSLLSTSNNNSANITDIEVLGLKSEIEQLKEQIRRQELLLLESSTGKDKPLVVASVGTSLNRKPGQVTLKMRKNRQEKLLAVRTQIIAWLNKLLSPEPSLTPENLMERLATGVIPCDLAIFVSETAIPILGRIHVKAQPYSIMAHENVQSFLKVCYEWGLKRVECFTAQDLLSQTHRNERLVVETLLSLSRVVYIKFGIEPPWIVKAEMEIDAAETLHATQGDASAHNATANNQNKAMMEEAEHLKLLEAIKAYCALHGIVDVPVPTENKGQFEFSDGTRSHIRMFDLDPEKADGDEERDQQNILDAVQGGDIVLLARHNNNWEELHKFLHDHSGGKKVDMGVVQHGAVKGGQATVGAGSLSQIDVVKAQEVKVEAPVVEKPQVVDVMAQYLETYEEEDEDDEDEDEEYLEQKRAYEAELRRIQEEEERRAREAKLRAEQAENELLARQKALLAQQQEEEEFKRQKQANKYKQSYLTDADLAGDVGEVISKVRTRMGDGGDINPQGPDFDPDTAKLSHIINTSDYKKFKDVTMKEIQIMSPGDLERLVEYTSKQEFFFLTALAVKMTHELTASSSFTAVSNQELWRRAIEHEIPFHKFYRFVYDEITKSYLEQQTTDRQTQGQGNANLRNRREMMIANVKERQKQKQGKHYD